MFKYIAGQFRKTDKNIGVDKFHISVELRQLCDDFKYWHQHNTYTPEERIREIIHH